MVDVSSRVQVCAIQAPHWPVLAEEPFVERWTRYLEQLEA